MNLSLIHIYQRAPDPALLCPGCRNPSCVHLSLIHISSRQPELSDGKTVTLTGIVEEIAEKENSRQIRLSHIHLSSDLSYQRQVLVYENQQTTLKIGYKVKAAGSYAPLEEASNPGQFDQRAYRCV